MGTWSPHPFGNDTASDWAYELEETNGLTCIESTLDAVLAIGDGYLDAYLAEEAIAAVEVLAKLRGRGTQADGYTQAIDAWVAQRALQPPAALLAKAQAVLVRVLAQDSELRELWEESTSPAAWHSTVAALQAAVAG